MLYNKFKENADSNGEKIAIICDENKISYNKLNVQVEVVAQKMLESGIQKGEKIIIFMKNSINYVIAFLAINKLGSIAIPINAKLPKDTLGMYIELINPKAIFYDTNVNFIDDLCVGYSVVFDCDNLCMKIVGGKSCIDLSDEIAEILFTSGTTGIPKGIMLTNENVLVNIKSIHEYLEVTEKDILLIIKPLHHSSTLNAELLLGLFSGSTVVMTTKLLSPKLIKNIILTNMVSIVFTTPLLLEYFSQMSINDAEKVCNFLKTIHFYGAILKKHTIDVIVSKMPAVELIYSYGLTEASPRVTYIKKNV